MGFERSYRWCENAMYRLFIQPPMNILYQAGTNKVHNSFNTYNNRHATTPNRQKRMHALWSDRTADNTMQLTNLLKCKTVHHRLRDILSDSKVTFSVETRWLCAYNLLDLPARLVTVRTSYAWYIYTHNVLSMSYQNIHLKKTTAHKSLIVHSTPCRQYMRPG